MKWFYLFLAGALEITWAVAMKKSNGFTVIIPSIITGVGYIASAVFLAIALKQLPLCTAYAMWTGTCRWHVFSNDRSEAETGKEFRNGFDADLFLRNYIFLLDYDVT